MKNLFRSIPVALLLLAASSLRAEEPAYPGDDALYVYRAELERVISSDVVSLDVDLGFFVWRHKTPMRLRGIKAPDRRTEEGQKAMAWLMEKLRDATELGELRVKTYLAEEGADILWLGELFVDGKSLNAEMVAAGLAVRQDS